MAQAPIPTQAPIEAPAPIQALEESASELRVSTLTLKDGSSILSNSLEVNSGEPHTLTCTSSVSRPTATIIWYFGGQKNKTETTRTSTFTFTPDYSDNQEQLYCKAFNIQSESQAVSSNLVSLYVKVKVANVTLKDGNTLSSGTLKVTNGVSKTLTCTASEILATTPTITDLTTEKLEGDHIKYRCTSSQTRPVAIVTWKLGTQILSDVQNTEHSHGNDLKSVTSIVTFTANRTGNNKTIQCETTIPGQSNLSKAQDKMPVYWPPSQPRIMNDSFPFLEGQTGKSIYCSSSDYGNPTATATWTTQYGTPDSADTRKLRLPKLTYQVDRSPVKCQLNNLFTQRKGLQIQSKQYLLQVEYSPRIQILVDGKQVSTTTKDEGQTLSATCNATGNPNPVVDWLGQQPRGPTLSFDDIDRTDHGRYTCKATATSTHYPSHNFITEEELNVIVNYAPDVTVNVSSRNPTENNTLTVKCEPKGRPTDYHFSSIVHKWGDVVISKVLNPTNGVKEVQNAQLQDSGTYICEANNGIRDRSKKLDQSGNNTVNVKGL
ncbi:basement membrane-specific heparan sulfate proteoglycan core protein-like [Ruditapes philippinarum]|uniref:basement membrane-specific heparan sulfate proteoglycan core protein-like n=1 Tax=Ruditapes philippinarum TaxID=129788 RepID=UPI00295A5EE5|nr:basement membrane-specific heparan sulfate proteoglycan core protein-like [Ruditapes philippinarum]